MKNRSVPTDILLPHIVYRDIAAAAAWLSATFGFVEHYRYGEPLSGVQMHLGDAWVMIHGPREWSASPAVLGAGTQSLTVFVPDVEAQYQRVKAAGGNIVEELTVTVYGERQFGVADLDGHHWLFSQHARDVNPEEWGATIAAG